jgi:hypothetical protein
MGLLCSHSPTMSDLKTSIRRCGTNQGFQLQFGKLGVFMDVPSTTHTKALPCDHVDVNNHMTSKAHLIDGQD